MNQNKSTNFVSLTKTHTIILLLIIFISGIIIRIFYTPFNVPLTLDSVNIFVYSLAFIEQGFFPTEYLRVNLGWPSLLSMFLVFFENSEMLKLMNVQRIISIIISTVTIIPIFYLTKIFFRKETAIISSAIFVFEPHLIINSINGGTMSLFILLVTLSILFSFKQKNNHYLLAFIFGGVATFVRYEGFLILIPLIFSIFIQKNNIKGNIKKSILGIAIFFLIVIPISFIGYEADNRIIIFDQLIAGGNFVTNTMYSDELIPEEKFSKIKNNEKLQIFIIDSLIGYVKFFLLTTIPILIIGISVSMLYIRKMTKNKIVFLIFSLFLSVAGLYAYGRGIEESKYIFPLIPIMILLVSIPIEKILRKTDNKKIGLIVIATVLVVSIPYIEFQKLDYQIEREIYESALFVVANANGVNDVPGGRFVKIAELEQNWPELPPTDERGKMGFSTKKINIKNSFDIENYLENSKPLGLTHIVVYKENQIEFLDDIFAYEEKYPYLSKVYDSSFLGHGKHIKIFEIDYLKLGQ